MSEEFYKVNKSRRNLVIAVAAVPGAITGAAVVAPFVATLAPSERAKAAGAPVTVDVANIKPGEKLTVEWRGKVVWVMRRTPEQVAAMAAIPASQLCQRENAFHFSRVDGDGRRLHSSRLLANVKTHPRRARQRLARRVLLPVSRFEI